MPFSSVAVSANTTLGRAARKATHAVKRIPLNIFSYQTLRSVSCWLIYEAVPLNSSSKTGEPRLTERRKSGRLDVVRSLPHGQAQPQVRRGQKPCAPLRPFHEPHETRPRQVPQPE